MKKKLNHSVEIAGIDYHAADYGNHKDSFGKTVWGSGGVVVTSASVKK